ncbi:MAG: dephospho-CoA kinase [Alphaproteobacteria bacterium]|nr:dephospho-CoA kinase [Alphaproteobacteria bacterium]
MIVLGLTGSIGMGKSVAAAMLRRLGVPVHDADAAVHRALGPAGAAIPAIRRAFPQAIVGADGRARVDRRKLGALVFGRSDRLRQLEKIVHPLVRQSERAFLRHCLAHRTAVAVIDVPLLFETGGERRCTAVVLVSAPEAVQTRRALARPGMTKERLAAVRAQQMPDGEKRRRADFVVPTGAGKRLTWIHLRRILRAMTTEAGRARVRHARNRTRHRNHRA